MKKIIGDILQFSAFFVFIIAVIGGGIMLFTEPNKWGVILRIIGFIVVAVILLVVGTSLSPNEEEKKVAHQSAQQRTQQSTPQVVAFTCPSCGAVLNITRGEKTQCEYCGTNFKA